MDAELTSDLRTLAEFIEIFCAHKHGSAVKASARLKTHDLDDLLGGPILLCTECTKLLAHSFAKRSNCPLEPKPACKHCPDHCYHPSYRASIREVMAFSGRKLVLTGRVDYLFRLLF